MTGLAVAGAMGRGRWQAPLLVYQRGRPPFLFLSRLSRVPLGGFE